MFLVKLCMFSFSLLLSEVLSKECSKIQEKLDDSTIDIGGPYNDICILKGRSCCNKAVEQQLLSKTKETLKNMIFLVLNKFYQKIDYERAEVHANLTALLKGASIPHSDKIALSNKFSSYITGINSLTSADLDTIKSATAIGSLSASLSIEISPKCQSLLFYELEPLKEAELKYLSSILLTLRGYDILTGIIEDIKKPALTEECYIGAVRGGLKFGGCELCLDRTAFAGPCVKLCRNVLSGCLKGHIDARDMIQSLAQYQIKLNEISKSLYLTRNTALDNLIQSLKNKLRVNHEFYNNCSSLQTDNYTAYSSSFSKLSYDVEYARNTLDSSWLCTFVFGGVSEVNCWNTTDVGQYRKNVYEYTIEGQFQNPEVIGDGPAVDISKYTKQFADYKTKIGELEIGSSILKPNSVARVHLNHVILLSVTCFIMSHL